MNHTQTLEFHTICEMLADHALTAHGKEKARSLQPTLGEQICHNLMKETTNGRKVLDALGSPPLAVMDDLDETVLHIRAGGMLHPPQFTGLERFLASCKRMKAYLKRAESNAEEISAYGNYIDPMDDLREEINRTIRNEQVDSGASPQLKTIRRKLENATISIKTQMDHLLRTKKEWFSEAYMTTRQGRYVLPVKPQYKNQVAGTVIERSQTGGTYFIEPTSVRKTQEEITSLQIAEDSEIIKILYTLTGVVQLRLSGIEHNKHCFETLDFIFAKAKLSASMKANAVTITTARQIQIIDGRHPLLDTQQCVPLNFQIGEGVQGVIITGPNTGGKTVALKTVGLLSLMAQSGLHVPAHPDSIFAMHNQILCDIGDGQSIAESLSTFSAHMTSIIAILKDTTPESLVLLDELGSGTDPAEGMGLAVSIIEELLDKNCLFVTTTHYPEVKDYASHTPHLINARMAFDRENLTPQYRLEIGEAGESCALYIAQKLGLSNHLLQRAHLTTYGSMDSFTLSLKEPSPVKKQTSAPQLRKIQIKAEKADLSRPFQRGDSVLVSPEQKNGIVFHPADSKGIVCVQIQQEKIFVNHKRIKLLVPSEELYPADYDFSIVFDTVANRKARHEMDRGSHKGKIIHHNQ